MDARLKRRRFVSHRAEFLKNGAIATGDECQIWPFAVRASSGYGAHCEREQGRVVNIDAHVAVCTLVHGHRPSPEHQAAHSCGHALCCNGRHLRWATPLENMADAIAHGRLGNTGRKRLSDEAVVAIRASDLSLVQLGRMFGAAASYIGKIRRGEHRRQVAA